MEEEETTPNGQREVQSLPHGCLQQPFPIWQFVVLDDLLDDMVAWVSLVMERLGRANRSRRSAD